MLYVPIVAPAPSSRCPSLFPPHEQLLAAAVGGTMVVLMVVVVLVVPSPSWLSCGGGAGHPCRACLRWCPCPHPLSLSWCTPILSVAIVDILSAPCRPCPRCPRVHPTSSRSRWRWRSLSRRVLALLLLLLSVLAPPVHLVSSCPQQRRGNAGLSLSSCSPLSLLCQFPVPIFPNLAAPRLHPASSGSQR